MPCSSVSVSPHGFPRPGEVVRCAAGMELAIVMAVSVVRQRALLATETEQYWENLGALLPMTRPAPNPMAGFVAERCVTGRGIWVVTGDLRSVYLEYRENTLTWRRMTLCLLRMGLSHGMRWIVRLGLETLCWTEQDSDRRQYLSSMGVYPVKVRTWEGIGLK